jgi:FkbM family methyltransferase
MASLVWVTATVAIVVSAGCWLARRRASRRLFAPGSLLRQYERCRDLFRLEQFEIDNILNPIARYDEYRIAGQRFRKDDVIIDVGAHVGIFSYMCHEKGSRAIYAFEASPPNFARLRRHVGKLSGVHCAHAAVWRSDMNREGFLFLSYMHDDNTGSSSVLAGGRTIDFQGQRMLSGAGEAKSVSVIPLDAILERFDRVKLLKLDCEGSEFPILLTSSRLDRVDRIVGELHECGEEVMAHLIPESRISGYGEYRSGHLVSRLESLGFRVQIRRSSKNICLLDAWRIAP